MTNRITPILLPILALLSAGCSPPIWNAYAFDAEQVEKTRADQPVFIYFRSWADPQCTKFEQNVLEQADVRSALAGSYRVVLEHSVEKDAQRAKQWGVTDIPGVAMLGMRGQLLASASGYMTRETLLALIQRGKQEYAATKSSATPAASTP